MNAKRCGCPRHGPVPDLLTTGEAAARLGAEPAVFRFAAHLLGLPRRVVGRAVLVTDEALYAVRDYLARVDPGGVFWDPSSVAQLPAVSQDSGDEAVSQRGLIV